MRRRVVPGLISSFATACAAGCFTYDTTPPVLLSTAFDEGTHWLHDRLWFDFDDDIDFASWEEHAWIELPDGSRVPAQYWRMADDESRVAVEVEHSVIAAGTLSVRMDGVLDTAGNPLEPMTLEWVLGEWTIDEMGVDLGEEPGPPAVEVMPHPLGDASPLPVVVWTVGQADARRFTGIGRQIQWNEMGEHQAETAVAIDVAPRFGRLVVLGDGGEGAEWSMSWDPELEYEFFDGVAATSVHRQVALVRRGNPIEVELQGAGIADPVALPELAAVGSVRLVDVALPIDDAPVVAHVDQDAGFDEVVRVTAYAAGSWQEWATRVAPGAESISVVADVDEACVVWVDESGPHVARAFPGGIEDLPLPGLGASPQLRLDGDGFLVAAWIEAGMTGRIARWEGTAWQEIAAPWVEGVSGIDAVSFAMWDGRSPIVAWREGGRVRVALYNGPVVP